MALMSQPKICHTNLLQIKYYHTNVRFLSQAFPRIDGICKLIVILLPLFTYQSIKERVISFHNDQPIYDRKENNYLSLAEVSIKIIMYAC